MTLESLVFKQRYGLASRVRVAAYRALGAHIGARNRLENIRLRRPRQISIGNDNSLAEGCWLFPQDSDCGGYRIRIGNRNFFNRDVMIDACGSVEIGDHNMFGPGVYITDSNHTTLAGAWVADCPMDIGTTQIGSGCWIGTRAIILKGVTLGDRCIVAAGAVVNRSVPAGAVVAGVPAREIRQAAHV